jgi:lipopolysaccharide/colanic/teichoic acid biosynthesis glycosyltransferase
MRVLAIILIFILSPILLGVSFVLFISGKGKMIYNQKRVGKDKIEIIVFKFRTMTDNKITTFGKILRKTSIDELPQLFNIIKSNMAFVGPRPLTQSDIDRLEWNDEKFSNRWSVKPGITGAAQLVTVCDKNLSMREDLNYIANKSFKLDIKILIKSMLVPFVGKGAAK